MYTVENIVSGEVRDTHVTRVPPYASKELHVTQRMSQEFQQLEHQAEFHSTITEVIITQYLRDRWVWMMRRYGTKACVR